MSLPSTVSLGESTGKKKGRVLGLPYLTKQNKTKNLNQLAKLKASAGPCLEK